VLLTCVGLGLSEPVASVLPNSGKNPKKHPPPLTSTRIRNMRLASGAGVLKKSPGNLPGFLPGNCCDMAPPIIFKHHFLVPRMGPTH